MSEMRMGDPFGVARHRLGGASEELAPGPLTLSGDLFLILLDDVTGRLRVRPRIAGYAISGALLVELWWTGQVAVEAERVRVLDRGLPEDPLSRRLVGWMMTEPARTNIAEWVECLATVAVDAVADELVIASWIRRERRMGLAGRREVFVPVSRNAVFWRAGRLAAELAGGPTATDLALIGLLDAVGVAAQTVGRLDDPDTAQLIREGVDRLSVMCPSAAVVCGCVQALSARAAISRR